MKMNAIILRFSMVGMMAMAVSASGTFDYDGTISGKEILTPKPGPEPKLTGAVIFGVRPGKPIRYCATAIGEKPVTFSATGLPTGVSLDPESGWVTGRAPQQKGDVAIMVTATNAKGSDSRKLTLRVGDAICLTPPMGWNSWYVHSEGVSEAAIREMATAMKEKGLQDYGWSYVNIDDCWMGERDPETKRIQANGKFVDMKAMVEYVNSLGLKVGIYSTPWMSTFAGYIGGTAPNEVGDYSAYYLPESERQNPYQVFGRFPSGIDKCISTVGPVWFVDRDAQQFADWGIDYVKYDWLEWDLLTEQQKKDGMKPKRNSREKREENGITQRFYSDFRALDRDVVISLSPRHSPGEDAFVQEHCNLWRLTEDIHAKWHRLIAPFDDELVDRLAMTRPGGYGDLDMLQIGPLGRPNRAEKVFRPSPLTPAEQYHQVTLWCLLTQPMLLSCNVPTMDEFDLNLVANHEVLAVNQDALCKQGYRVKNKAGSFEIWAKDLADGGKAVGLFNVSDDDQVLTVTSRELGMNGPIRDLWRQKDIGMLEDSFTVNVSAHGVVFIKIEGAQVGDTGSHASFRPGELWPDDNGVHINAHGGGVLYHGGTYYWYGEHKIEGGGR
jgi:alpha-galactosidase